MTSPGRYLFRMVLCLAAVVLIAVLLQDGLVLAFMANPYLNGLILTVFLFGIGLNFRHVLQLKPEVLWLEDWRTGKPQLSGEKLKLLAPMATMLGERRGDRVSLSAMALRSLLDSIASRLDEGRDLARYFIGLMIFLGLLGTFWGLSRTVGSIGDVIRTLSVDGSDASLAFEALKGGLEAPLTGMGTAFSTSLFGLAGSVVLGFLDLQAGQAQNVFYNELEEWLAGQTRLGSGGPLSEGADQSVPAYIQALLEQTADSLDSLQRTIAKGEDSRSTTAANIRALTDKLSQLGDHMKAEQQLLLKLGEAQMEMRPILMRLADSSASGGMDEASRIHLRNLDTQIGRLVDISSQGYESLSADLRHEFRLLARTIAAAVDEPEA